MMNAFSVLAATLVLVGCGSSASVPLEVDEGPADAGKDAELARDAEPAHDAATAHDAACTPQPFYVDADGDGYGGATPVMACEAPANAVSDHTDCDDVNKDAHPGQSGWFTTPRADGSYDYDCDGASLPQYVAAQCTVSNVAAGTCSGPAGFSGSPWPACGKYGTFITCDQEACTSSAGQGCQAPYTCSIGGGSTLPEQRQACH